MMGTPLTTTSTVGCGHEGKAAAIGAPRLTIDDAPVLLEAGIVGAAVSGCTTVEKSDASGPTDLSCKVVLTVTAGKARKLFVDGAPVMLAETLAGATGNTPVLPALVGKVAQAALSGTASHARVSTD